MTPVLGRVKKKECEEEKNLFPVSDPRVVGALEQQFWRRGIMTEQVGGAKFCQTKTRNNNKHREI